MFHFVRVKKPAGDHPCRVDPGDKSALEGTTCARTRCIECDNGGLRHAASQQPPYREEHADTNEKHADTNESISENLCSHKIAFLSFFSPLY
jgi:hypothetical protein